MGSVSYAACSMEKQNRMFGPQGSLLSGVGRRSAGYAIYSSPNYKSVKFFNWAGREWIKGWREIKNITLIKLIPQQRKHQQWRGSKYLLTPCSVLLSPSDRVLLICPWPPMPLRFLSLDLWHSLLSDQLIPLPSLFCILFFSQGRRPQPK